MSEEIQKWLDKGWRRIVIKAGETATEEIVLDRETDSISVLFQMFDDDGRKLRYKPHVTTNEAERSRLMTDYTVAVISTFNPVKQNTHVLYEIVACEYYDDDLPDDVVL